MKIYKTINGIIIEHKKLFYALVEEDWDKFINDDQLYSKIENKIKLLTNNPGLERSIKDGLTAPIQSQEIWASGVTYKRSKIGRQEESKDGGSFYAKVYEAERPELFFKSNSYRTVGSGQKVSIRKDSSWNVPEPELTLFVTSSGKIMGYTIGNDMSSRSIEGENPLYLPQAKVWDTSASIGPCIYVSPNGMPEDAVISMEITRANTPVFSGEISINQIHRKLQDLVSYLYSELTFPHGCFLMTGTGIVPPGDFTLNHGDQITITIDPIGTLVNFVK